VTQLYQVYADPYDLLTIKLLALHVSQHQDEALVKDIWDRIFHEGTSISCDEEVGLLCLTLGQLSRVSPLPKLWIASKGQLSRLVNGSTAQIQAFHSVRASAPTDQQSLTLGRTEHIARLLVEFQLANTDIVPPSWAVLVLVRCGIPYVEIWDVFHQMYESQVCLAMHAPPSRALTPLARSRHSAHNRQSKCSRPLSVCFSKTG
jgi:nuclear pore complex protein Nup155